MAPRGTVSRQSPSLAGVEDPDRAGALGAADTLAETTRFAQPHCIIAASAAIMLIGVHVATTAAS